MTTPTTPHPKILAYKARGWQIQQQAKKLREARALYARARAREGRDENSRIFANPSTGQISSESPSAPQD